MATMADELDDDAGTETFNGGHGNDSIVDVDGNDQDDNFDDAEDDGDCRMTKASD
jgi:hypothetical protein